MMQYQRNIVKPQNVTSAEVKNLRGVRERRIEKAMRRDFDNANDAADLTLACESTCTSIFHEGDLAQDGLSFRHR